MKCLIAVWVMLASPALAQPTYSSAPTGPQQGDELQQGVWPGVSLEDLRGMRECSLDDRPPVKGQAVVCRPPVLPSRAHLSFDLAWMTGLALTGNEVQGINGFAFDSELWVTRGLGIGTRFAFAGVGTTTLMGDTPRAGKLGEAMLALHWRAFTDEVDRDGFALSLGGGYAFPSSRLGNSAPIVRVALSRFIGYVPRERSSLTWAWEVAGEQFVDDAQGRIVTAGVRAGFEVGIRAPQNLAEPDTDAPFRYAIGGEIRGSAHLGVGGSFSIPLTSALSWRTLALWTVGRDSNGTHGLRALWGAVAGPHLMLGRGIVAPYVDLQGGPAAIGADAGVELGWIAEAEGGAEFHFGCQTRLDLGGRIQTRVDGFDVRTGFFILRIEHGRALRHSRGRCEKATPIAQ